MVEFDVNEESGNEDREAVRARARRKLGLLLAALLGAVTAVAAVLITLAIANRDSSPEVNRKLLDEAVQRWEENGPASYDVETVVEGPQRRDVYRVSVRDGEPVSLVHNGTQINRPQGWHTWSVPGMFDTIRRDVTSVERVEAGKADKYTPQLRIKADFDPKYGYPKRYRRTPKSGGGQIIWHVTKFKVIEPKSA